MKPWSLRPDSGHYIARNEASRIPRRHVIFDVEARSRTDGRSESQTFRCAAAIFLHLTDAGNWVQRAATFTDRALMWKEILAFTRPKRRTVLWAHNLAYDLRASGALVDLEHAGWPLVDIRLANHGTWAKWSRDTRTLVAVDSSSVWPCGLERLAEALDMSRPSLPTGDDMDAWLRRAEADARVLAVAVREWLTWLRAADMGTWQFTGSGQAWGAWRHKHYTHKILVADDLGAREAERRAMWTGRAEAWIHGTDATEPVIDLDFANAYARIAAEIDIPVRQATVGVGGSLPELLKLAERFAVLAEVEVITDEPVVPTSHNDRIVWPTGRFTTVLWDPELRLLAATNATVSVSRVWLYRKAPALRSWAKWILGELGRPAGEIPEWRRIALKHWSRALIGRFAMRYKFWEDAGRHPDFDVRAEKIGAVGDETPTDMLHIGHKLLTLSEEVEGANAVPSITGYIMSEARARLWRAIQRIGPERVLYVDTDSLLVDLSGHTAYRAMAHEKDLAGLRVKGRHRGWSIAGPRQLVIGRDVRIAGVPRKAERVGEWTFSGHVWRGLAESVKRGEPDSVTITRRTWRIRGVDNRRVGPRHGRTLPIKLGGGESSAGVSVRGP